MFTVVKCIIYNNLMVNTGFCNPNPNPLPGIMLHSTKGCNLYRESIKLIKQFAALRK